VRFLGDPEKKHRSRSRSSPFCYAVATSEAAGSLLNRAPTRANDEGLRVPLLLYLLNIRLRTDGPAGLL
jgi:hypothetical protein